MTILNNGTRNQYTATGGQTTFIYSFEIFDQDDIVVYRNTSLLSIGTHYTVTGVGNENGGTIVLTSGATSGDTLTIFRDTAPERLTDYQQSGDFLASEINSDIDRLWAVVQEQKTNQSRFLQTSEITEVPLPVTLEDSVTGQFLRWKDPSTVDSVPASAITPSGEITTDYARNITNYAALRAIDTADFADGQAIVITDAGIAGDFILRNVTSHGITDDGGVFIVINTNWYAQRIVDDGIVKAEWFGFLTGQGSSFDAAVPFNAASTFVRNNRGDYHTVTAGGGVAHIQTPIKILQSVSYDLPRSNAVGVDGLEFVATPQLAAMTPPSDIYKDNSHLSGLVLAKTPMVYNTQLLTHQDIGSFCLDANGEDVYGVYINERYFSSLDCFVRDCPNAPITLIYNQFNEDGRQESRECSGPVRYVMCNTTTIAGLDIELCDSSTSCLDIVHSISTKNNVRILNMHYEESDAIYPTGALARFGGRGITLDYGHWTMSTVPSTRYIDFLASATSYSIDGATVSTTPCLKVEFIRQMFTANTAAGRLGTNANSVRFDTTLPLSSLVNNSTVYNHILSDTTGTQLGRQTRWTNSDGTRLLGSTQDNRVNLYSNDTRYFDINGANIRSVCTGGYWEHRAQGHRFFKGDGSQLDWQTPLYFFGWFVWIDAAAGAWRRNATAPTSDTDGTLF